MFPVLALPDLIMAIATMGLPSIKLGPLYRMALLGAFLRAVGVLLLVMLGAVLFIVCCLVTGYRVIGLLSVYYRFTIGLLSGAV